MSAFSINDLIVPLNRPEYPSSPEIFLTSLAWSRFDVPGVDGKLKRRFKRHQRGSESRTSSSKGSAYTYSWEELMEPSSGFAQNLQREGLSWARAGSSNSDQLNSDLLRALLAGVSGTTSEKSDSIAVSPMIPSLALMQTVLGMKGTSANFAGIFEQIGGLGGYSQGSIGDSWVKATESIMHASPFLRALDNALDQTAGFGPRKLRAPSTAPERSIVLESLEDLREQSPFGWFARSWENLTNESWVQTLPPRVWTDWANSLLRTAFGFTYLWEASWYHRVADLILTDEPLQLSQLSRPQASLLPWMPSEHPISLRGVKPLIDKSVRSGGEIRELISKKLAEIGTDSLGWEDGMEILRGDTAFRKRIASAKNLPSKRQTSTVEAVNYSLNIRKEFGEGADYFGLLSLKSRKYRVPDPGTEWLAMVVSLASPKPGGTINLGKLLYQLNSLGLNPPTAELIRKLENAGLARGSSDSDFGMEIESAF